ncbi:MAG: hypothetical protein KQJ78_21625 [Deltaproteobacteria bacterium]|nr:hypothetical protein [Deltaproteobacteria bacterium]
MPPARILSLVVCLSLFTLLPGPASAAVFDVASEAELAAALAIAAANDEDDTINLASNYYSLSSTLVFDTAETNHSLVLQGVGGPALLDGGNTVQVARFTSATEGISLTLQNLHFRHGAGVANGAGLAVQLQGANSSLHLADCTVLNNVGGDGLGPGSVLRATALVEVRRCRVQDNAPATPATAFVQGGGMAIVVNDIAGRILVSDSLFTGNQGGESGGAGGALYCTGGADYTLVNNTVVGNHAGTTGGVFLDLRSGATQPQVVNNVIRGNTAVAGGGADLYCAFNYVVPYTAVVLGNNILGARVGDPTNVFNETGTLDQDPALDGNFRPTEASPGRDTGDNNAPNLGTLDLGGMPRVQNQVVDRGAYEYPAAELLLTPATLNLTTTPGQSPVAQIVTARNLGGLGFQFGLDLNQSWLAVDPASAPLAPVGSRDVTVSFATGNLAPGAYKAQIVGHDLVSGNSSQITVNLTVEDVAKKPVYRLYNPGDGQHFFTSDPHEAQALAALGWADESTPAPFYLISTAHPGARPVHRLYNPAGGAHYLTLRNGERDALVNLGWRAERDQGWAFPSSLGGASEVATFYDPATGFHFYTANPHEVAWIQANLPAWQQQSPLGYAYR